MESDRPLRAEALRRVIAQLAEIQDRLLELPSSDLAARHELHVRHDQLREEAADLAARVPLSLHQRRRLETRLASLRHRLADRSGRTLAGRLAGSGAGVGMRPSGVAVDTMLPLDREALAGRELDELRRQVAVLEDRLTSVA